MLCPCCGRDLTVGVGECGCGARFVGDPLDEAPIKVKRFGPVMITVMLLVTVVAAALIFTKWLAFAGVVVIWSASRAMRLARREPDWYGGYRVAASVLVVTIAAGVISIGLTIAYVPRFLENRRERQSAATRAKMYHAFSLLEEYKRTFGSYPTNSQEYKKAMGEALPSDFWNNSIDYKSYTESIAENTQPLPGRPRVTAIPINNFELRSPGPDGKAGTDDDIIMRDGLFYTDSEVKKQPLARPRAVR